MKFIPITYQGKQINIATQLRYTSKQWIVFLHGLGCTKETFAAAFEMEGLQDYSMCSIDFVGFGQSDQPDDFSYDLAAQAEIVSYIIKELAMEQVHLVAHSMGGAIGLLVIDKLASIRSFVNVEGNLVAKDCGIVSRGIAKQQESAFKELGFMTMVDNLHYSNEQSDHQWAKWCEQCSPFAFHRSARSLVLWSDSEKLLPRFQQITNKTYICGEKSRPSYLDKQLTGIKTTVIAKSGHFMMLDNPYAFYDTVTDWIKRMDHK